MFTRGYSHISVQDSTLDCSEEELIDEDDKRVCHLDIVGVGWLPWARLGAHEKIGKKTVKNGWLVNVGHSMSCFFGHFEAHFAILDKRMALDLNI